jgi:hypothetical protein
MVVQLPEIGRSAESSQFTGSEKEDEKRGSARAMQIDGGTMINGGCQREKIDRYKFTEKKADTTDKMGDPSSLLPGSTAGSHPLNP